MPSGGRLFLEGAQSCVFDTPTPCKGRPYTFKNTNVVGRNLTRKVYKIIDPYSDSNYQSEIDASTVFSKIPDYQDYFVLIDNVCQVKRKPDDWQSCKLFKQGAEHPVLLQFQMEYGGMLLTEYVRFRPNLYKNWLRLQINVAESLKQLHVRNWVHGDLHSRNIIIDNLDKARIIDFGQSYNVNRVTEQNINLNFLPEYDIYGPEMDYLAGISTGAEPNAVINQIYRSKRILLKIDHLFPSQPGVLDDMQNFAKFHVWPLDVKKYISMYSKPADIWSVGCDFLLIYLDMISDVGFSSTDFFRRNHRNQMLLFRGMLATDPRLRYSIDDVLKELYSMRLLWV